MLWSKWFKDNRQLDDNRGRVSWQAPYSFVSKSTQDGMDFANYIRADQFTGEYFQSMINNNWKTAYKELHHLKVAYDELRECSNKVQTRYITELEAKEKEIRDLQKKLQSMKDFNVEKMSAERMPYDINARLAQLGSSFGGSASTSRGHIRQGNDVQSKLYVYSIRIFS
jgi:hypothetical protein